jgi:signal transduction histidine kinase
VRSGGTSSKWSCPSASHQRPSTRSSAAPSHTRGVPERAKRLHRASLELLGSLDQQRTEREIVRALRDIVRADASAVMLKVRDQAVLAITSHEGLSDDYVRSQRVPFEDAKRSFRGSDDHVILDLRTEGFGDKGLVRAEGLAKVLAIPLVNDGEFIGSLNAYMKQADAEFNSESIDLAHVLAVEASVAIANARRYRDAVEQRDLQRAIFDALGEGVVIVHAPGQISTMNDVAQALLGIDKDDPPINMDDWMARFVPRDARTGEILTKDETPVMRAMRGEDVHMEVHYTNRATGEQIAADVKARAVRSGGEIVAAAMSLYDLTELRRLEQEKEQFLSIVSHELRTPLTPLKALAQLLISRIKRSRDRDQPLDLDSLQRNLATIERQVDRMNGLVSDLLSVSRAGRGKLEMDRRPFDLAQTVRDTVEHYVEATREEGRHSLHVDAPPSLLITGDQARVEQMLMNIIGNAVKYSPRGGDVRVALSQHDGRAEIVVADQGIGISREDLARIGPAFTRGSGRAATFAGMGIGLHVAKLLADAHGGSLELESEGDDRGTTVRISLPA